jgi:hypothetical protein
MSDNNKYNGWTNYETWATALWIDNDRGASEYWRERAEAASDKEPFNQAEYDSKDHWCDAAVSLGDAMREEFLEAMPDLGPSLWADLLNASMCEVNWIEIAHSLLEDFVTHEPAPADEVA